MIKKLIQYIMIGALVSTGGLGAYLILLSIGSLMNKLLNRDHVIDIMGLSIIILILSTLVAILFAIIGFVALNGISQKRKDKQKW